MEQKHREIITKNLSELVERTRLDQLLIAICSGEDDIFPYKMMEPFLNTSHPDRSTKMQFYSDIQRRGPNAFQALIKALRESGHWDLVKLLSPEDSLNTTNFISLSKAKKSQRAGIQYPVPSVSPRDSIPTTSFRTSELQEHLDPSKDHVFESIKVIKSTKLAESPNPEIMCYNMKSKKRGVFFMINNIVFENDKEEYRSGALKDQENLSELFSQIGFHKITIHNNLTKEEMLKELRKFSCSDDLEKTDCVFVVVASHGISRGSNDTSIITYDNNNVSSNDILEIFNNKNCPMLHNVPKIFIFQLCRGDTPDFGIPSESSKEALMKNRTRLDGKVSNASMRTYSDMLIAHSTVPGFSSHRDVVHGSWYMLSLCEIFMKHAHDSHLEDLFKLVDRHLKDIHLKRNSHQTSSVESRGFNKYCFLNPGFFVES